MHADIVAALRSPGVGAAIALYVDFVAFARGATLPALDLLPVLQYLRERGNASRDAARERFGLPALAAASAIDASPRPPAVPISESATTAGELPGPAEEPAIVWDMDASELAAGAAPGDDPSAAALEIDWDVSDAPTVDGDAAGASAVAAPGADDVGWAIEVEDAGAELVGGRVLFRHAGEHTGPCPGSSAGQRRGSGPSRRRTRGTSVAASTTMAPLILLSPTVRSVKVMGTSTTRKPRSRAR